MAYHIGKDRSDYRGVNLFNLFWISIWQYVFKYLEKVHVLWPRNSIHWTLSSANNYKSVHRWMYKNVHCGTPYKIIWTSTQSLIQGRWIHFVPSIQRITMQSKEKDEGNLYLVSWKDIHLHYSVKREAYSFRYKIILFLQICIRCAIFLNNYMLNVHDDHLWMKVWVILISFLYFLIF